MFLLKIEQYLCDLLAGLFGVFQTPKDIAHVPASLIFHALCFLGVCRAVPHSGQAYHALSALACASRLVGLYERGRVVTGEVLDEIA